ncbi:MAG: hypothetical protein CMI60_18770 [Parvibaculum sp.]|nr:hypothetical protein [Parvibaculum sp.]|tara:strand:+ start:1192 stop:1635 length:444 start_codon:yes stop_codon:yes gene_type:complete
MESVMKIVSSQRPAPSKGPAKKAGPGATGAVFSPDFGSGGAQAGQAAGGVSSLTSIHSLLAVQGVDASDDSMTGRRRAIENASETLDILDDLKLGLLAGELPADKLQRLLSHVSAERSEIDDPALANVLDHIELRARVELAKYGRAS